MTLDTLNKAEKIRKEIEKLERSVTYLNSNLDNWDKNIERRRLFEKFPRINFGNKYKTAQDRDDDKKSGCVFIDTDDCCTGLSMDATPELVAVIRDYFQDQLEQKTKEFNDLK